MSSKEADTHEAAVENAGIVAKLRTKLIAKVRLSAIHARVWVRRVWIRMLMLLYVVGYRVYRYAAGRLTNLDVLERVEIRTGIQYKPEPRQPKGRFARRRAR